MKPCKQFPNEFCHTVTYAEKLGFQFKVYVEYWKPDIFPQDEFDRDMLSMLNTFQAKYIVCDVYAKVPSEACVGHEVTPHGDWRIWYLLRKYGPMQDKSDMFLWNNFYPPFSESHRPGSIFQTGVDDQPKGQIMDNIDLHFWVELALVAATIVLVVATAGIAWTTQAVTRETMKADLFERYSSRWESPTIKQSRSLLAKAILAHSQLPPNEATPGENAIDPIPVKLIDEVGWFFEELGLLSKKNHLDEDFVWDAFGNYACVYWDQAVAKHATARRKGHASIYWSYESLVNRMKKLCEINKDSFALADRELQEFLVAEAEQTTVISDLPRSTVIENPPQVKSRTVGND